MSKRKGLPDFMKSRHSNHLVDEIATRSKTSIIRMIPIERIAANMMQPRQDFGNLVELADSIKEKGILEPIIVRPKDGKFEIIAGERRYRAAKMLELMEVPCIEHDVPDNEALEITIIENLQRKDLNIFESAYSLQSLADIYGYTHQEIAQKIGKSRVTVTELLRLTDLPQTVVNRCHELKITSKTFLLELVKLEDQDLMNQVLDQYSEEPFSRDKIKDLRSIMDGSVNPEESDETDLEDAAETLPPVSSKKPFFKFNFATDDKAVKIDFKINSNQFDKGKLIDVLENLLTDIREDRIDEFKL